MLKYRNFTILLEKRDLTNKIKKFANVPEYMNGLIILIVTKQYF